MHATSLAAADTANHVIRKVRAATGVVTLVAGQYGNAGYINGVGSSARLGQPYGLVHFAGYLYCEWRAVAQRKRCCLPSMA
eukprot:354399-Chlamydomonas_euryale.AAC.2